MMLVMYRTYLLKWGLESKIVDNFQTVLEIYIKYQPELVILDIGLPFLMVIIGVKKFVNYPKYLSFFYLVHQIV